VRVVNGEADFWKRGQGKRRQQIAPSLIGHSQGWNQEEERENRPKTIGERYGDDGRGASRFIEAQKKKKKPNKNTNPQNPQPPPNPKHPTQTTQQKKKRSPKQRGGGKKSEGGMEDGSDINRTQSKWKAEKVGSFQILFKNGLKANYGASKGGRDKSKFGPTCCKGKNHKKLGR